MQKTFRLPETTVRILVLPTIGHLLYIEGEAWQEQEPLQEKQGYTV